MPEFIEDYNRRFSKLAKDAQDAHRKVRHNARKIDLILSQHSTRKFSNNLELSYQKSTYQISAANVSLKQKQVTVCELFCNEVVILHEEKEIPYQVFGKGTALPALVDEKTINARVEEAIRQQQTSCKPTAPRS